MRGKCLFPYPLIVHDGVLLVREYSREKAALHQNRHILGRMRDFGKRKPAIAELTNFHKSAVTCIAANVLERLLRFSIAQPCSG
jgi:hypothetical protein